MFSHASCVSSAQWQDVMTDVRRGQISTFRLLFKLTTAGIQVHLLHCQNKRIRFHCKMTVHSIDLKPNKALVLNLVATLKRTLCFSLLADVTQAWSSVCHVHTLLYGN